MSLESAVAAESIKNWDALRDDIINAIDNQCSKFPKCEETTNPLTKVTEKCQDIHLSINKSLYSFDAPPFTIQRVAELALDGDRYYSTLPKYLGALQHILNVSSTTEDFNDDELKQLIQEPVERDVMLEPIDWVNDREE